MSSDNSGQASGAVSKERTSKKTFTQESEAQQGKDAKKDKKQAAPPKG